MSNTLLTSSTGRTATLGSLATVTIRIPARRKFAAKICNGSLRSPADSKAWT